MARVRYSLEYLQDEYSKGNHEPLDKLIRAFRGIQDYSRENPNDPNGFFVIGGFHGEPFHGAGAMSSDDGYWGYVQFKISPSNTGPLTTSGATATMVTFCFQPGIEHMSCVWKMP